MTKWHVSIVGAFDRFNYGDVLFAKVAEHMIGQALPGSTMSFHALRPSDLRSEGGVVTDALSEIYRFRAGPGQRHLVLLSGGELLAPTWTQMAEHLVPRSISLQLKRLHRRTGHAMWNGLWRRVYGCPNLQPWTVDPDDLAEPASAAVAYNAVGGTSLGSLSARELQWQKRALQKAAWITVRDAQAADAVEARGLPRPRLAPDSAVIMPALLDEKAARDGREAALKSAGLGAGPYLCFQAAERWARGHESLIADQLRAIHSTTGLNIMSFAIGRAAGHDDQVTSQRLEELLGQEPWFGAVHAALPVNGIMALIAGSAGYVGTSLHGFITAFAFARPRVGLMAHIGKLTGFRDAWDIAEMPTAVPFEAMAEAVQAALAISEESQRRKAAEADANYRQSFADMIATIEGRPS